MPAIVRYIIGRMKLFFAVAVVLSLLPTLCAAQATGPATRPRDEWMQWWRDAKFGLFIHWGPVSLIGDKGKEISWSRVGHPADQQAGQTVPAEEYDQLYRRFNPTKFDAGAWMRMAKGAGMKYVVFVTKHHDGFAMWDTKLSDYSIAHTPFRRDICKEIADAAHAEGLRLGWYYSTRDWHHPDYLKADNARYNDYYEGQVRELLSNYGKVDVLWFDHVAGQWNDYRFVELFDMIYRLQPDILINDRAAKFVFKPADQPTPQVAQLVRGDFTTPEKKIGKFDNRRAWESCMTMTDIPRERGGGGWSYRPDGRTRTYEECLTMLVNCVTGDGNLLLNVGPGPTGEIDPAQIEVLGRIGKWLERNGASIYSTRGGPYKNGEWGGSTYRDRTIYLHVLRWPGEKLTLPPLPAKVTSAATLAGKSCAFQQDDRGLTVAVAPADRDAVDTVIALKLDGPAAGILPIDVRFPTTSP